MRKLTELSSAIEGRRGAFARSTSFLSSKASLRAAHSFWLLCVHGSWLLLFPDSVFPKAFRTPGGLSFRGKRPRAAIFFKGTECLIDIVIAHKYLQGISYGLLIF